MQEILNFIEVHFLILVACSALLGSVIAVTQELVNLWEIRWGILFRWGSLWIGGHWSAYNKRLCVNPVPMITIWITREGGETPDVGYGFDIYRSDKHKPKKSITITNVVDHQLIDDFIRETKASNETKEKIQRAAREKLLADQEIRGWPFRGVALPRLPANDVQRIRTVVELAIKHDLSLEDFRELVDMVLSSNADRKA